MAALGHTQVSSGDSTQLSTQSTCQDSLALQSTSQNSSHILSTTHLQASTNHTGQAQSCQDPQSVINNPSKFATHQVVFDELLIFLN